MVRDTVKLDCFMRRGIKQGLFAFKHSFKKIEPKGINKGRSEIGTLSIEDFQKLNSNKVIT